MNPPGGTSGVTFVNCAFASVSETTTLYAALVPVFVTARVTATESFGDALLGVIVLTMFHCGTTTVAVVVLEFAAALPIWSTALFGSATPI